MIANPGIEQKARPCAVDLGREAGWGALQLTPKDASAKGGMARV